MAAVAEASAEAKLFGKWAFDDVEVRAQAGDAELVEPDNAVAGTAFSLQCIAAHAIPLRKQLLL